MKFAIVFVAICAVALAAPVDDSATAQILRYDSDVNVDGYNFAFETSDGVSRSESGQLKNAGTEQEAISVQGQYSFIADDGQEYTVKFIADENGFQPTGDHIPSTA